MIRRIIEDSRQKYNIESTNLYPLTSKTYVLKCEAGGCYFVKKTDLYAEDKYSFLNEQGVTNIAYPIKNRQGKYVSKEHCNYYIMDYHEPSKTIDEVKAQHMKEQLTNLHYKTYYKKQLSVSFSHKKIEELYEYLNYKFNLIEVFVRSVESQPFDEYSITILKNYQYILMGEREIARLHKKLIQYVKSKKSVNHSFVHNNPKLDHLINIDGYDYLTSIEKSKIGIPSLDIAKLYLEIEDVNIDIRAYIMDYFKDYDDEFYFDYFCFLVLLYYIKGIIIIDKDYVTSQSFIYASSSIKTFLNRFTTEQQ